MPRDANFVGTPVNKEPSNKIKVTDEYDIATGGLFNGVEFSLHSSKEILLDYQTLYYYLRKVCDIYLE